MVGCCKGLMLFGVLSAIVLSLMVQQQPDSVLVALHTLGTYRHHYAPVDPSQLVFLPGKQWGSFPWPSPQLIAFDGLLRQSRKDHVVTPQEMRQNLKAMADLTETHEVPLSQVSKVIVPESQQPAWWVHWPGVENGTDSPTIIYTHGGGRIAGSAEDYVGMFYKLSRSVNARVFGIEYSLGPETSILTAVDDAIAAYRHVVERCGVPSHRVVIAGESGGGLMASLLLHAIRDRSLPLPAGGWIISPQTDLSVSLPSHTDNIGRDAIVSGVTYPELASLVIGDDSLSPQDPRVSPLFASWSSLPPLFFSVSENEVLRDDTLEVVAKARAEGADVTLDYQPNVPHAYPIFVGYAPELDAGFEKGAWFLAQCLSRQL